MKNIAILTSSLSTGGAERIAGLLSVALTTEYNVYIVLLENKKIQYEYGGQLFVTSFTEKYNHFRKKICGKVVSKFAYLSTLREIRQFKEEHDIDCTISLLETPNIFNILSRKKDRVIVSVRSTRSLQNETLVDRIENFGIKLLYKNADCVVATSYGVADDLIKNFHVSKHLVEVVYNICDVNKIRSAFYKNTNNIDDSLFEHKNCIVSMGRLIPSKQQIKLINICHGLFDLIDDPFLIIMGDGPLEGEIRKEIDTLGENNRMTLLHFQDNPFYILHKAKVFVMNTEREGFCNSILEAMACKTAVVSTDCYSGPREIIADYTDYSESFDGYKCFDRGILCPVGNDKEMQLALKEMLLNDSYRVSCIEKANLYLKQFSSESIMSKWIALIESK